MSYDIVKAHTPDGWTLIETRLDGPSVPNLAVWEYDVRPNLTVRVDAEPDREETRGRYEAPHYRVVKEAPVGEETYSVASRGFVPKVELAEQIMRGVDGLTAQTLGIRLCLHARAASALAVRVEAWEDLIALADKKGGFSHIDGVGKASEETIVRALSEGIHEVEPVELLRLEDEGDGEQVAVYLAWRCAQGWKLRKEWRSLDGEEKSSVMLPVDIPGGEVYKTPEDVCAAVERLAGGGDSEDDGRPLEVETPTLPDAEPEGMRLTVANSTQAELRRWE